jgi:hypothetical protein
MTVSSSQFFNALATKQYNELIQMYGSVAIEALQSYQNGQMKWMGREGHARRSSRGMNPPIFVFFSSPYPVPFSTSLFTINGHAHIPNSLYLHCSTFLPNEQKKNLTTLSSVISSRDIRLLELEMRISFRAQLTVEYVEIPA